MLARPFLPEFFARNPGRVLNVASTAPLVPGPLQAACFATKAFVHSFSNAIAEELGDSAITVTTLLPGATDREFARTSGMDKTSLFNNTTSASEVTEVGYEAMRRGDLDVVAGVSRRCRVLMRFTQLLPKRRVLKSVRNMREAQPE